MTNKKTIIIVVSVLVIGVVGAYLMQSKDSAENNFDPSAYFDKEATTTVQNGEGALTAEERAELDLIFQE